MQISWDLVISDSKDRDSQLLVMARDKYKAKLHPITLLSVEGRATGTSHGHSPPLHCAFQTKK